jgi:molecular chaperone DnaJ
MNFYIILGLTQDASTADIKRAYRRLARRYHPGINPGDRGAEAMYQRISEAYETLVDPARRQRYDSGGHNGYRAEPSSFMFAEFDFSATKQGAQASTFTELFAEVLHPMPGAATAAEDGADVHVTLTVPFIDAVRGVERQVVVTRQVDCGACAGAGQIPTAEGKCAQCQGSGHVRWARGHMVFSKPCPSCEGRGRHTWQRCAVCAGQGLNVRSDAVSVVVPAGTVDGARLRLPERGHAGRFGGRHGDLYVTLNVQPHPIFHPEGDDLVCVLPVAVHEAALGARIDAPALDGTVKLRIPPGTQSGQRLRVSGRGLPNATGGSGDLLFEVRLVLPPELDDRSKELMRKFGEINAVDVRSELTS